MIKKVLVSQSQHEEFLMQPYFLPLVECENSALSKTNDY